MLSKSDVVAFVAGFVVGFTVSSAVAAGLLFHRFAQHGGSPLFAF